MLHGLGGHAGARRIDDDGGRRAAARREIGLDGRDLYVQSRLVCARVLAQIGAAGAIALHRGDLEVAGGRERHRKEPYARIEIQHFPALGHGIDHRRHQRRQQIAIALEERLGAPAQRSLGHAAAGDHGQRIGDLR
jgi:hypothetical protein